MAAGTATTARTTDYSLIGRIRLADDAGDAAHTPQSEQDGFHRSWIMILPQGRFDTAKYGQLDFDRAILGEIKKNFECGARGVDLALDYDHKASEGDSRAPGWIERLALGEEIQREPGLWALVRWTPLGLADVKAQIYRYISAEYQPDYHNDFTKKDYKNVLIGATLTNRPVMKTMPAIALSDGSVSRRAWGSVDKATLPDACFLDPKQRRLPVYEGAGEIGPDGRYTRRGALNLNAVSAALAAVHGARSGAPMTGLPAGVVAKLERWSARYGTGTSVKQSERTGDAVGRGAGMFTNRDERDDELDEDEKPTYQFASKGGKGGKGRSKKADEDSSDSGDQMDEEFDEDGDALDEGDDTAQDLDEGDDGESYDESSDADDMEDDDSDGPAEGESKRGGKGSKGRKSLMGVPASGTSRAPREMPGATRAQGGKMSERAERGERLVTLAESRRMREEMRTIREENARLRFSEYQHKTEDILTGWSKQRFQFSEGTRKDGTKVQGRGSIALSKVFRDAYRAFMLSESGLKLSEKDRTGVNRLVEIALSSAIVDLSERGSSFDQETRKTIRRGGAADGIGGEASVDRLQQVAETIALSEHGKAVQFLSPEQMLDVYRRAEREANYE